MGLRSSRRNAIGRPALPRAMLTGREDRDLAVFPNSDSGVAPVDDFP